MKRLSLITLLFAFLGGSLPATAQTDSAPWQLVYQAHLGYYSEEINFTDIHWKHEGHTLYFVGTRSDSIKTRPYMQSYDPSIGEILLDTPIQSYPRMPVFTSDYTRYLVPDMARRMLQIYSADTGELLNEWPYTGIYQSAEWTGNDQYIVASITPDASNPKFEQYIWTTEGELLPELPECVNLAVNRYCIVAGNGGTEVLDAQQDFAPVHTFYNVTGNIAWHPEGRYVAVANDLTKFRIWDSANWQIVGTVQMLEVQTRSAQWNQDGSLLVVSGADAFLGRSLTVSAWSFPDLQLVNKIQFHDYIAWIVGWNQANNRFTVQDFGRTVVYDETLTHLLWEDDGKWVALASMSPDGEWLARGIRDSNSVTLHAGGTGELLQTLEGHKANIVSIELSPDGQYLYSVSEDGDLRVWGRE